MINQERNLNLDLTKTSNEEILSRLERLTKSERKITHLILWHILEVDTRRLYLKLNYDSLYKYLTQHLNYSESAAYDRIQAMRILKQVPEVATKIEDGSLHLTQLVRIEQSLKQEKRLGNNHSKEQITNLIEKLENKTNFETEKILACELNQAPKASQKVTPQSDNSIRLELTLSEEQYELLKKAQSYVSHIIPQNNLAEVIAYLTKILIEKKEGKRKSPEKPIQSAEHSPTQSFRVRPKSRRKYIAQSVRYALLKKANFCCEHVSPRTKQKCGSKYQLQVDHITPLAKGGTDEITNLRVLCGVHNRGEALKWGLRPLRFD